MQLDGQRVLVLMVLGKAYLGKGFICHDEYFVRLFTFDRKLVDIVKLALLLYGIYKKAAFAILDTPAWWDSRVPWILFLPGQSHEQFGLAGILN